MLATNSRIEWRVGNYSAKTKWSSSDMQRQSKYKRLGKKWRRLHNQRRIQNVARGEN